MQDGCVHIGRGRPKVQKTCPGCGKAMSAREFHDHSVEECIETARFERVWQSDSFQREHIDPHYYQKSGSMWPSTLAIVESAGAWSMA